MIKDIPKGFNCSACGKYHEFGVYVVAHFREELIHTCECGAKHSVICCIATPYVEPTPKRKKRKAKA